MLDEQQQEVILEKAQQWFEEVIMRNHLANTEKLKDPDEFNINPFLAPYLAGFFSGEITPESVAKVLVYPRVLGPSITTSFGQNMQSFVSNVLGSVVGSLVPGIDLEFIDAVDNRRKYCQAKLGPNTINADDVITIHNHFKAARNLGRTNNVAVQHGDLIVGVLYGNPGEESGHYKRLRNEMGYPLFIGREFWHRLTGNPNFYSRLQKSIANVAIKANASDLIDKTINRLAGTQQLKGLAADQD